MRLLTGTAFILAGISIVGCGGSTSVQPDKPAQTSQASPAQAAAPTNDAAPVMDMSKPEIDPTYANDTVVYMIGPHVIQGANVSMPNAYAHAEELYLVTYPQASLPLPSGYVPQCNPCFHPGLPQPFVFHDHIITGAPGMGNNGTAGEYKAPWKIIILRYDPTYIASPNFKPLMSAAEVDAAENPSLHILLPFSNGPNPYEIETGNLLICPTVSNHA
jgi:hypothetical protein